MAIYMNEYRIVVIDDVRELPETYALTLTKRVYTFKRSQEALETLERFREVRGHVNELWLDHDLGGDDTVMPVVSWLVTEYRSGHALSVDLIFVHSMNPVGVQRVMDSLRPYYPVVQASFPMSTGTVMSE